MRILRLLCFLFLYVNARPYFGGFLTDYHNKITENGYDFGYRIDGTKRSESGQLISSEEGSIFEVKGDYSYKTFDDVEVSVNYSSGRNGYRAKFVISKTKPGGVGYAAGAYAAPKPISTAAIASLAGGGLGRRK